MPRGKVVVYTSSQAGSLAFDEQWLQKNGVRVIRDRSKILLPTPRVIRAIQRLITQESISTVWFGAAAPLAVMSNLLRKKGVKRIVALTHGHEVWWAKIPPFTWAMRTIGRGVDHLGYLGEFTKNAIAPSLRKQDRDKLIKIAPGIDTEHFRKMSRDKSLISQLAIAGKPTIVSVGRLVHRKGQDRLIEAMPTVLAKFPSAVLIFVGVGPHRRKLEQLITRYGINDSVRFIGRIPHDDLPKYFALGDIFAMPSRSRLGGLEVEGLGIVYLEASACGIPVLAGNSGGAPDAVIEGSTGLVVDGNNVSEIAAGITTLLINDRERTAMGEAGRAWVVDEWDWRIWSRKFNALLGLTK